MAGRVYRIPLVATSLGTTSGGVDLWAITSTAVMAFAIEEIRLDPCATSVSEFNISLNKFTGSFTAGSGGSTATPVPTIATDTAAATTCKTMNTTKTAVGTGTKTVLDCGSWNLVNGWAWQPLSDDHRIFVAPAASPFVCVSIALDTTPASQTVNGCVIIRELI